MVRRRCLAVAVAAATILPACSSAGVQSRGFQVAAAFYPVAFAAGRLAAGLAGVYNLTPAGAEPHDIELTAGQVRRISRSDIVFYLGGGFQPAVDAAVRALPDPSRAVDLTKSVKLKAGDAHTKYDPHVWLDPILMSGIAGTMASALAQKLPSDKDALAENLARLDAQLKRLDSEYRTVIARCKRRDVITSHAAFGYPAGRYGFNQIPISGINPETEPSPRRLEEVASVARSRGATTIFFETLVSSRVSEAIAREVHLRTAALNPIEGLTAQDRAAGRDYFSIMRDNLSAISKALDCAA